MNTVTRQTLILVALIFFASCKKDDAEGNLNKALEDLLLTSRSATGLDHYILPASTDFAKIPQDPNNPITAEKVELGKHLYHETGLAINPKVEAGRFSYSCSSCHHSRAGFQAGRKQGIGEGGAGFGLAGAGRQPDSRYLLDSIDVQPIRTPTVLNTAYQKNTLWNGQFGATELNVGTEAQWTEGTPKAVNHLGFEGVETQAIAGLKVHRMGIDEDFCETTDYKKYFEAAFPNLSNTERYSRETAGLAIAAYERTVLANEAPFQKWLRGDKNAMLDAEKRGAILFFGKANCNTCHTGPGLNKMAFAALGMPELDGAGIYGTSDKDAERLGRGGFTGNPDDNYKFKIPQLYNLKDSPFLGHGGNFTSVREVVEYKNTAVPANAEVPAGQLAADFVPLGLTDPEMDDLTFFIENALYDPTLDRYDPASLPSGNCFPNNDAQTKLDLGCN